MSLTNLKTTMSRTLAGLTRPRTAARLIRRAEDYRRDGRYEEAGEMVGLALRLAPQHVLGHLLRAYLHVASRDAEPAKTAFAHVLSLDSHQPRALLGLARLALEEGDHWSAREFLERAVKLYPDFAEASALLDVVGSTAPSTPAVLEPPVAAGLAAGPALRRTPANGRDLVLARADGGVVFAESAVERGQVVAAEAAQVARIAGITLARCGLGRLRRSVVDYAAATVFARTEEGLVLSVSFPAAAEIGPGQLAIDNLWTDSVQALGVPA